MRSPSISPRLLLAALGGSLGLGVLAATAAPAPRAASALPANGPAVPADHAERMAKGTQLFTAQVRGILAEQCLKCHGGEKTMGGLDLSTREALLKGGAKGAAITPGSARGSRLLRLVRHQEAPHMPLGMPKLTDAQVTALSQWIDLGAPYDKALVEGKRDGKKPMVVTDADRRFWSFQPLRKTTPPTVKQVAWCRTPVDRFILARVEAKGLHPNPVADRRTLLRRAYFDLIGLPPTPEETAQFLNDRSPDAWPKLIDRLLANPHYGERWGRHWLDLARFAESHGYEQDYDRPNAYHYRDFVIKALNQDLPYDTFVKWQLAGDELDPQNPLALAATGFLAAGTHATQITKSQVEKERYDELDDMLRTTTTSMLGLTAGCARCHDHKYDPIPTRDYYRLLSTFTTTVRSDYDVKLDAESVKRERDHWEAEGQTLDAAFKAASTSEGRSKVQLQIDAHKKREPKGDTVKMLISSEGVPAVRTHTQGGDFLEETHFLKRGDPNQKGEVMTQGFLSVLERAPDGEKHWQTAPPPGWRTSYRRRSLAAWMTDTDEGAGHLLARVIVNRLWQHHFGRGIVGTPSDFGMQGERPANPELLDWLASELIRNGWRLKPIHKLLMTSAVYMQNDDQPAAKVAADPENRLCARRSPQRLEAEIIRDSLLHVSGLLDESMFGPGTLDETMRRRSIYFFQKRSRLIPMMVLFDAPDALQGLDHRAATTIAPQALLLMNNPQVRGYAESLASRVCQPDETPNEASIRAAYLLTLARQPTARELADGVQFLREQSTAYRVDGKQKPERLALADLCQALFCLNEFVYVD